MEKKEYGWCGHVTCAGFYTNGGTALRILARHIDEAIYIRWKTPTLCVLLCEKCYNLEYPMNLVQLRQYPAKPIHE